MNLILLQPEDFTAPLCARLSDNRVRHINKVLKATPGKVLRVGLLNGALGEGTVESISQDEVRLNCRWDNAPEKPRIDLLLAMPRPKVMKRLFPQIAALGVGKLVLVNAGKVERFYFDSHVLDPEIYTPLLMEGLQQARCTHLPEVIIKTQFKPFVEDESESLFADNLKLLADPAGKKRLSDYGSDLENSNRVVLSIGPEGGWTEYERDLLQSHGFELVGLGSRILRTDTACIGLLSMLAEQIR